MIHKLLILFILISCSPEQASRVGYALGYSLALQATYKGSIDNLHYYKVNHCNRSLFSYKNGNYNRLDCRYYDIFRDYVVETTYKISTLDLYYEK